MDKIKLKLNKKANTNFEVNKREYDISIYYEHIEKNILEYLEKIKDNNNLTKEDKKVISLLIDFCNNIKSSHNSV
jgi:Na+/phosphate symporter